MKKLFICAAMLVILFAFGGCSSRERESGYVQIFGGEVQADSFIQNDLLRLDFLAQTAEIVLTCRITGDYWRSTPEGAANCNVSAAIERFYKQSMFILTYSNRHGVGRPLDSYRFSVRNSRFEHAIVDGGLEVYFTLGDILETFHIPDAIYEHRLNYFTNQMERMAQMTILNAYRPINLERLRAGDSRSELLEQFPTLEYGYTIHVLMDNIAPWMLREIQYSLYAVGYTYEEWLADMHYFNVQTTLEQAAFNITMRFELVDNQMILTIPLSDITYVSQFMPRELVVLPYFVAGHGNDDGYLFVPDGSGAIMRFDSGRYNQTFFSSRMFGWDEAIIRESVVQDNRAAYPVFGVYRNGSTLAAIIEHGASYANIIAEVAGMNSTHSRVHPSFRLLHGTPLDVAGRTNDSLYMFEWDLPQEDIVIRYVVTPGDGYVGMAHAYRAFLQERYPWLQERVQYENRVYAMVEFLGAALTPQHFLGFPIDRPYPLTTYDRAAEIMESFYDFGWRNLHVKMRGAHNDSIDHIIPTSLDLISQLGGRSGFNTMVNTAERLGFEFYLEGDFVFMRGNEWFNGFRPTRDAARQANRERVEHNGWSHVYFGALGSGAIMADPIILARPQFTIDTAQNFVEAAARRDVNNIAFRCMASALAGDFNEDRHVTREAAMNMRVEFLSGLRDDGTGVWLNYGFSFAVPFANVISNVPLTDQGFNITCMAVPFYQIAMHGIIPFAGRPLNLAEDHSYHMLKGIESGAVPFFSFMDVPTADLQVTRYRRYFANEFARWQNIANDVYHNHVANFGHLFNQFIVDHQILSFDGVTVTVYEDGTRVYVNTTMRDFTTPTGVTVPARPATPYVVIR